MVVESDNRLACSRDPSVYVLREARERDMAHAADDGTIATNLDHALEAIVAAVCVERAPAVVRAQVCGALVAVARVAGLVEALTEGVATLTPDVAEGAP